jgi:small nuclear ribonucleoprotein (snRNP)-like protein
LHNSQTLASFDQFSNLVLLDALERRIVAVRREDNPNSPSHFYTDIPLGLYIVRGESLVVIGEVHDESNAGDDGGGGWMQRVSLDELQSLASRAEPPVEWDFDGDLIA